MQVGNDVALVDRLVSRLVIVNAPCMVIDSLLLHSSFETDKQLINYCNKTMYLTLIVYLRGRA